MSEARADRKEEATAEGGEAPEAEPEEDSMDRIVASAHDIISQERYEFEEEDPPPPPGPSPPRSSQNLVRSMIDHVLDQVLERVLPRPRPPPSLPPPATPPLPPVPVSSGEEPLDLTPPRIPQEEEEVLPPFPVPRVIPQEEEEVLPPLPVPPVPRVIPQEEEEVPPPLPLPPVPCVIPQEEEVLPVPPPLPSPVAVSALASELSPRYNVPDDIFVEDEVVSFSESNSPQENIRIPWDRLNADENTEEKEKEKRPPKVNDVAVDEENIENIEKFLQIEEAKARRRVEDPRSPKKSKKVKGNLTGAAETPSGTKKGSSPPPPPPGSELNGSEPKIPPPTKEKPTPISKDSGPQEVPKKSPPKKIPNRKRGRRKGSASVAAKKRRTSQRVAQALVVKDHATMEADVPLPTPAKEKEIPMETDPPIANGTDAITVESEKEKTFDEEVSYENTQPPPPSKPKLKKKSSSHSKSKSTPAPNSASNAGLAPQLKAVQNWKKVIRVPGFDDRLTTSQIFKHALPTYIPCVPRNTSQRLIDTLTEEDLDQIVCPGCRDRFLIPASFFKHIYRKSVAIQFACQSCHTTKTFHNPCQLKMHVLSHLEIDGIGSVGTDMINIQPIESKELCTGFIDESFARELDLAHEAIRDNALNRSETDDGAPVLVQCLECKLSIEASEVQNHYESDDDPKRIVECDICSMILPNSCNLSAHKRIHGKLKPFLCPDCGSQFQTWSVFQTHLQTSCQHEFRTLAMKCKLCSKKSGEDALIDSRNLLSHMFDKHVKLYYKCTGCTKAFDSKSSIYEHRSVVHTDADENEADFHLMYKATFLSAPNNLFSSRESFEQKVLSVTRNWDKGFLFKCFSCQAFFELKDELRQHNQRWCQMQNQDSSESSENVSKLFPSPKKAKLIDKEMQFEEKLAELKELCPTACNDCSDLLSKFRIHFNAHADKDVPDQQPDKGSSGIQSASLKKITNSSRNQDVVSKEVQRLVTTLVAEEDNPDTLASPRVRPKRSISEIVTSAPPSPSPALLPPSVPDVKISKKKGKETSHAGDSKRKEAMPEKSKNSETTDVIPQVSSKPIPVPKGSPSSELKLKSELLKENHTRTPSPSSSIKKVGQGRGRPSKKGIPEAKPFVETLGIDVPSNKTLLAFNRLHKKALSLGSSVVQKKTQTNSFKCRICGFKSEFRDGFQAHIRIHRPRENPEDSMQCLECGMCFASQPAWKTHLLLLHGIKKPRPEDFCQELVVSPMGTPDIRDTTTDEDSETTLVIDEKEGKLVTPRQNVCQVCKKAFSTPLELRKHFRGHGMAFLKNIPPVGGGSPNQSSSGSGQ